MVSVGGIDYQVVYTADDTDDGGIEYQPGLIKLRPSTASREFATLVHETLHAAFDASAAEYLLDEMSKRLDLDSEQVQETLIRCLAPALIPSIEGLSRWHESRKLVASTV